MHRLAATRWCRTGSPNRASNSPSRRNRRLRFEKGEERAGSDRCSIRRRPKTRARCCKLEGRRRSCSSPPLLLRRLRYCPLRRLRCRPPRPSHVRPRPRLLPFHLRQPNHSIPRRHLFHPTPCCPRHLTNPRIHHGRRHFLPHRPPPGPYLRRLRARRRRRACRRPRWSRERRLRYLPRPPSGHRPTRRRAALLHRCRPYPRASHHPPPRRRHRPRRI
jgi:hypothetical protein